MSKIKNQEFENMKLLRLIADASKHPGDNWTEYFDIQASISRRD